MLGVVFTCLLQRGLPDCCSDAKACYEGHCRACNGCLPSAEVRPVVRPVRSMKQLAVCSIRTHLARDHIGIECSCDVRTLGADCPSATCKKRPEGQPAICKLGHGLTRSSSSNNASSWAPQAGAEFRTPPNAAEQLPLHLQHRPTAHHQQLSAWRPLRPGQQS